MQHESKLVQVLTDMNRFLTVVRRRHPRLRTLVPPGLIKYFSQGKSVLTGLSAAQVAVLHQSSNVNIYHCCVHKTGSQWIISLLTDLTTYRYSGLGHFEYQSVFYDGYDPRRMTERNFSEPFPVRTIVSPLYIDYHNYRNIPKSGKHKAFYVIRDPRDVLVSWYHSARYSHIPIGEIPALRRTLAGLSLVDGILYSIDHLEDFGMFSAMRSWADNAGNDPNVRMVRYEDLATNRLEVFVELFHYLDIPIPDHLLSGLIDAYNFKRLSGREQGVENRESHIRSGKQGSWKKYFEPNVESRFYDVTGDLVQRLGYC
ncbi:MAG TPA: sulfotransferase domain-containing protein [Syntrophobacter fumaroxidans]|nr:sulfotransferase domain-containing protein [Syntrophobacter fumaroxidans]